MINDKLHEDYHNYLQEFLDNSKELTGTPRFVFFTTKSIMAHFLEAMENKIMSIPDKTPFSKEKLVEIQIESLRECILELNNILNHKETIQ